MKDNIDEALEIILEGYEKAHNSHIVPSIQDLKDWYYTVNTIKQHIHKLQSKINKVIKYTSSIDFRGYQNSDIIKIKKMLEGE